MRFNVTQFDKREGRSLRVHQKAAFLFSSYGMIFSRSSKTASHRLHIASPASEA
jgi:hypothetical protein